MATAYMPLGETRDHTKGSKPVIGVGSIGCWGGEFKHPWGVAVDYTTDYIYVADCKNNRVQVLDGYGQFLFEFGRGLMDNPIFITIDKDTVFVSQISCLMVYSLDGNLIKQIGSRGSGEGQLVHPRGVAVDKTNGQIYVCDYFDNRVLIFGSEGKWISTVSIKCPMDIRITSDEIFVFSNQKPFLYTFDQNFTPTIVSDNVCKYLRRPNGFCIASLGNICFSDFNAILVFNRNGELIHKLAEGFNLRGIALDSRGRMIAVSFNNRVFIF